ncbi:retrotransposon line subclass [Hordeum vulgare]|nr:retrotransposon line subclass [Hordeum vulgare]
MFADDALVFFKPLPMDLHVISSVLILFADGSSLCVNLNKCSVTCIRCDDSLAGSMAAFFLWKLQPFPLQYLGIPLSTYRLQRHHIESLIDMFFVKMKGWNTKLLAVAGSLTLTKSVLMALLVHFMVVPQIPKWDIKMIDRGCRRFFWKGKDIINGGHFLLPWSRVCMVVQYGGLGVLNLSWFGDALRCKWFCVGWVLLIACGNAFRTHQMLRLPSYSCTVQLFSSVMVQKLCSGLIIGSWEDIRSLCCLLPSSPLCLDGTRRLLRPCMDVPGSGTLVVFSLFSTLPNT